MVQDENNAETNTNSFFAPTDQYPNFESIGITSSILLQRISENLKLERPSAVQASAFKELSGDKIKNNVIMGAETGSGKTLAYLLPLVNEILERKKAIAIAAKEEEDTTLQEQDGDDDDWYSSSAASQEGYDYCRAIILVPNKELAKQVLRMACDICGGRENCIIWDDGIQPGASIPSTYSSPPKEDVVRLAIMPGGLKEPMSFKPFRDCVSFGGESPPVDLVICTPAALGDFGRSPNFIDFFTDVQTVIFDECDMLLDGGYLRPLEDVLLGFRRADKLIKRNALAAASGGANNPADGFRPQGLTQHVFVGATIPDYGLKSVDAYISRKFPHAQRVSMPNLHNARHYGLKDSTMWLEQTYDDNKQERLDKLVELIQSDLQGDKIMVFVNTVDDVEGVTGALRRKDINAVPYHAKMPLSDRTQNLNTFRDYNAGSSSSPMQNEIPILISTDLASRGLDVPGVTAVVQLQFATNVVAHLHRMGRCGRAGNINGRGIIFYGPSEQDLVQVVREAEEEQEKMSLEGNVLDLEQGESSKAKVKNAFSRKRGFTKKRKKQQRREVM